MKAVLRTCDTSKAAATPAPVAPIATAPVVRPRLQPIAVQPDPEPEAPVSGGRRRVGGGSRFGGVARLTAVMPAMAAAMAVRAAAAPDQHR